MDMFENFEYGLTQLFDEDNYNSAEGFFLLAMMQASTAAKASASYYAAAPYYSFIGTIKSVVAFGPYINTPLIPSKAASLKALREQAAHIQSVLRPL